jgi:hypothetical protein
MTTFCVLDWNYKVGLYFYTSFKYTSGIPPEFVYHYRDAQAIQSPKSSELHRETARIGVYSSEG